MPFSLCSHTFTPGGRYSAEQNAVSVPCRENILVVSAGKLPPASPHASVFPRIPRTVPRTPPGAMEFKLMLTRYEGRHSDAKVNIEAVLQLFCSPLRDTVTKIFGPRPARLL